MVLLNLPSFRVRYPKTLLSPCFRLARVFRNENLCPPFGSQRSAALQLCRGVRATACLFRQLWQKTPLTAWSLDAILGQEFDKVAAVIDEYFYYDNNGKLLTKNSQCYSQSQMLFQILIRTREDLYIVVINNSAMLKRCLEIVHGE